MDKEQFKKIINNSDNIVFFGGAGVSTESGIPDFRRVLRNYCMKCHKFYSAEKIFSGEGIPTCECGGIIKPDVVLYEEGLDDKILNESVKAIQNADVLVVAGTSH